MDSQWVVLSLLLLMNSVDATGIDVGTADLAWEKTGAPIAVIGAMGFNSEPKRGDLITLLPTVDLPPVNLRLERTGVSPGTGGRNDWGAAVEKIRDPSYFAFHPKKPFVKACFVYPAASAVAIPLRKITKKMLPDGISLNTLRCAVALDKHEKPDAIVTEYCCGKPNGEKKVCASYCRTTYLKEEGKWKQSRFDQWDPNLVAAARQK